MTSLTIALIGLALVMCLNRVIDKLTSINRYSRIARNTTPQQEQVFGYRDNANPQAVLAQHEIAQREAELNANDLMRNMANDDLRNMIEQAKTK